MSQPENGQLSTQAKTTYRADYAPPAYWIDSVDLTFDLDPQKTRVLNKMRIRRNADMPVQALKLDGDELTLARVLVNGQGCSFKIENSKLVLDNLPDAFELEIFTTCCPQKNTQLMGLYVSNDSFFTQCEAEGFRRITYFLDRPDVMAVFTVTLRADQSAYPVLLSNGNLVEQGLLENGRHFAKWLDPFKKPAYLFALVAGQFVCREQTITSRAGNEHLLQVYVRPGDLEKTEHAMNSLMASVAWDEARFGLSLDLERFMIVATSDFNMGAMENKGLNIFNTKFVLASQVSATDVDFSNIESVVGHEYFHNWTGNRITCRDWFQLSLKEGLTVFRDQEFSQDMAGSDSARAVKRIEDVRALRAAQFVEDAGTMSHPVRPDSYLEISNFYTATIYEKGAEVVRMMQTLVSTSESPSGRDGFAKGMKLYFERFDGQAVTCDDFAQSIADANPHSELTKHLKQFKRWYSQSGTPRVEAAGDYDENSHTYTLTFKQHVKVGNEPYVIPVTLGLLDRDGHALPLQLETETIGANTTSRTLVLNESSQTFKFINIPTQAVPSLLRGFSAPVILDVDYTQVELFILLSKDTDAFNRWEAAQRLGLNIATHMIAVQANNMPATDQFGTDNQLLTIYMQALHKVLRDPTLDAAFKDLVLTLPSESYIAEQLQEVDPQHIHHVREGLRAHMAKVLHADWEWAYETYQHNGAYSPDALSSGRRALTGMALSQLCLNAKTTGDSVWPKIAYQRFENAGNMTDRFNALQALVSSSHELADTALAQFHDLFKNDALVIDKWFALQASRPDTNGDVLPQVRKLLKHTDFNLKNPNRARSLIFNYCVNNPAAFHRQDGAGYVFWCEQVLALDSFNPQVAARLARALDRWKKLSQPYKTAAKSCIERVAAKKDLSNDTREVITHALVE
ncbi:MAG TPA: aminopeptidase N [Burkholderiaceae bacterium]|mgnify:CR=1 FL=1|nr:aminopeptidase N [Burkholderiaceae bacterium]